MSTTKFYRFAFPIFSSEGDERKILSKKKNGEPSKRKKKKKDKQQFFKGRDGESFIQLMPVLMRECGEFDDTLLNYSLPSGRKIPSLGELTFRGTDTLVIVTRPPVSDDIEGGYKQIPRSGTKLETDILNSVKDYFVYCSRRQVTLSPFFGDKFLPGFDDRLSIQFVANGDNPAYQLLVNGANRFNRWNPINGRRTAAYFLYTEAWQGGPSVIVCWAMTGNLNLLWARLIRTKFPEFLSSHRLVVAEMNLDHDVPDELVDLSFVEDWPIQIILNHELTAPDIALIRKLRGEAKK